MPRTMIKKQLNLHLTSNKKTFIYSKYLLLLKYHTGVNEKSKFGDKSTVTTIC